jgi:diaminopimelate epimerase
MKSVPFTKMHGIGNDYIYFDCVDDPDLIGNPAETARRLSDRHFSIGGDGIVLVLPDEKADFRMRMFNSDGSEAEMCGNAIRCVAKLLKDAGRLDGDSVDIATGAGILRIETGTSSDGKFVATVDMGEPILNGPDIPVATDANPVVGLPVPLEDGSTLAATCVSMGNPHAVFFRGEITDSDVLGRGPEIETHRLFPNRINVEFAKVVSRGEIEMRVWERGAGETLACGTGACATLVAAVLNGLADRRAVLKLLGGELQIEWRESDNHVMMTGPAETAFKGIVDIP